MRWKLLFFLMHLVRVACEPFIHLFFPRRSEQEEADWPRRAPLADSVN
jgi:hypothetical protein